MEAKLLTHDSPSASYARQCIVRDAGVDTKDCYQCGKCSAGCPVASMADMTPREVIRNLQLGLTEEVLSSTMPWFCIGCNLCVTRCPQKVDMPSLMLACRRYAQARSTIPVKEVAQFNKIFIEGVRNLGVSDEAMLAMKYNLSTGHLFQDVLGAPGMFARGMIGSEGHSVHNKEEVRAIIDKVASAQASAQAAEAIILDQLEEEDDEQRRNASYECQDSANAQQQNIDSETVEDEHLASFVQASHATNRGQRFPLEQVAQSLRDVLRAAVKGGKQ